MKRQNLTSTKFLLLAVFTIILVSSSNISAQKTESQKAKVVIEKYELSGNAVKSLIKGIQSENEGLKKDAIFFAGEYKLDATVDYLIAELQKSKNPEMRILIVLSLHKIGNPIAIDYIKEIVKSEPNKNVKNMFSKIKNKE